MLAIPADRGKGAARCNGGIGREEGE